MMTGNNQQHLPPSDYETLQTLLPAYGLGITDPDETALVENLLAKYPEAEADLEEYRTLAAVLPLTVPQMEPPPHLLANLLQATLPDETPVTPASGAPLQFPRWLAGAVAAAVTLLVVFNIFSALQITNLSAKQHQLSDQLGAQGTMLSLFVRDEIVRFELHDTREEGGNARAVVLCNPDEYVFMIQAENFPTLSSERVFQVWLWRDDERTDGGQLWVDASGSGTLIFQAPEVMGMYEYVGIAPHPGSPDAETNGPVVKGPLYSVNDL